MERIRPYKKHAYKHNPDIFVLVDKENYELFHVYDGQERTLDLAIEVLLDQRFVTVIQGPGPWLILDLDNGVDPKGELHNDKIPPFYWEKLSDEIREKLK